MNETPMDRIEKERARRKLNKRKFAMEVIGISGQDYNNWLNRGLPTDQMPSVAGKFRWSIDYLWLGKSSPDRAPDDELNDRVEKVLSAAKVLSDSGLETLASFAEFLLHRDRPTKAKSKRERQREAERA